MVPSVKRAGQSDAARHAADAYRFDDAEVDDTLIDLMLELTLSDRLRSLSNHVSGLARFRRV
jgi:hypothetical protein